MGYTRYFRFNWDCITKQQWSEFLAALEKIRAADEYCKLAITIDYSASIFRWEKYQVVNHIGGVVVGSKRIIERAKLAAQNDYEKNDVVDADLGEIGEPFQIDSTSNCQTNRLTYDFAVHAILCCAYIILGPHLCKIDDDGVDGDEEAMRKLMIKALAPLTTEQSQRLREYFKRYNI